MSTEAWQPNAEDKIMGIESYVRYASGVAIMSDPERLAPVHALDVCDANMDEIFATAERLMIRGATQVIRYTNPKEIRKNRGKLLDRYAVAFPYMVETVKDSVKLEKDRLDALNPFLSVLQPSPMLDKVIYKYLCHSSLGRLTTRKLMDGMQPSSFFKKIIDRKD